jgi:hypothetical protein
MFWRCVLALNVAIVSCCHFVSLFVFGICDAKFSFVFEDVTTKEAPHTKLAIVIVPSPHLTNEGMPKHGIRPILVSHARIRANRAVSFDMVVNWV